MIVNDVTGNARDGGGAFFLLGAVGGTAAGLAAAAFGNGLLTTQVTLGVLGAASGLAASLFVE